MFQASSSRIVSRFKSTLILFANRKIKTESGPAIYMFISLFLNSDYVSSERRSLSIQKSFFSFFLHPTSFLAKSTSLPSRFLLVRINEFAVKVEKKTNHKTEFHLLRLRVIFSVIEGLIKITDIEGRKRLDFYANTRRIAREMRRIEKYTKDQTFVIKQILEKSVFFFPIFLVSWKRIYDAVVCVIPHGRENPCDTCTFASFAPTVSKEFFLHFKTDIFHRDEWNVYKLSISIPSRYSSIADR